MPVRAFLDSDYIPQYQEHRHLPWFQCPSGHFLIQTDTVGEFTTYAKTGFNARQGIS